MRQREGAAPPLLSTASAASFYGSEDSYTQSGGGTNKAALFHRFHLRDQFVAVDQSEEKSRVLLGVQEALAFNAVIRLAGSSVHCVSQAAAQSSLEGTAAAAWRGRPQSTTPTGRSRSGGGARVTTSRPQWDASVPKPSAAQSSSSGGTPNHHRRYVMDPNSTRRQPVAWSLNDDDDGGGDSSRGALIATGDHNTSTKGAAAAGSGNGTPTSRLQSHRRWNDLLLYPQHPAARRVADGWSQLRPQPNDDEDDTAAPPTGDGSRHHPKHYGANHNKASQPLLQHRFPPSFPLICVVPSDDVLMAESILLQDYLGLWAQGERFLVTLYGNAARERAALLHHDIDIAMTALSQLRNTNVSLKKDCRSLLADAHALRVEKAILLAEVRKYDPQYAEPNVASTVAGNNQLLSPAATRLLGTRVPKQHSHGSSGGAAVTYAPIEALADDDLAAAGIPAAQDSSVEGGAAPAEAAGQLRLGDIDEAAGAGTTAAMTRHSRVTTTTTTTTTTTALRTGTAIAVVDGTAAGANTSSGGGVGGVIVLESAHASPTHTGVLGAHGARTTGGLSLLTAPSASPSLGRDDGGGEAEDDASWGSATTNAVPSSGIPAAVTSAGGDDNITVIRPTPVRSAPPPVTATLLHLPSSSSSTLPPANAVRSIYARDPAATLTGGWRGAAVPPPLTGGSVVVVTA